MEITRKNHKNSRRKLGFFALILGSIWILSCEKSIKGQSNTPKNPASDSAFESVMIGPSDRPAVLYVSSEENPVPLYIMLHGYGSSGEETAKYLNIKESVAKVGGHLVLPDGRINSEGRRFWDATPACCEFEKDQTDQDEKYLKSLIEEASALLQPRVASVTLVGYSNGSFMSQRMACRQNALIDKVISFSGAGYSQLEECQVPGESIKPVTMVHIHGEWDPVVLYSGGTFRAPYPSASATTATWGIVNGCGGTPSEESRSAELSFEGVELGRDPPPDGVEDLVMETDVRRYQNCKKPTLLLTMKGLGHVPRYRPDIIEYVDQLTKQ